MHFSWSWHYWCIFPMNTNHSICAYFYLQEISCHFHFNFLQTELGWCVSGVIHVTNGTSQSLLNLNYFKLFTNYHPDAHHVHPNLLLLCHYQVKNHLRWVIYAMNLLNLLDLLLKNLPKLTLQNGLQKTLKTNVSRATEIY